MKDETVTVEVLEGRARQRGERRDFFRAAAGAAAAAAGGAALLAAGSARAQTEADAVRELLNFMLNIEYLEAQFFSFAVFGEGLPNTLLGGEGDRGRATGGRKVAFADPALALFAREIAQDERSHVEFLRLTIGNTRVAQPRIDISPSPSGAFSTAARGAGLVGAGESFNPYASDANFLLGAFFIEDVAASAYRGAVRLLGSHESATLLAGLLATESYHAGLIRTVIFRNGAHLPALRAATVALSDYRDSLDGPSDRDQGVVKDGLANVAPVDGNGTALGRGPREVLNVLYLNDAAVIRGGFFPAGFNGTLRRSDAN